jgi:hypothetical protein
MLASTLQQAESASARPYENGQRKMLSFTGQHPPLHMRAISFELLLDSIEYPTPASLLHRKVGVHAFSP